jgi:hypothetical protein
MTHRAAFRRRNATPASLKKIADALNCPLVALERKRHSATPG